MKPTTARPRAAGVRPARRRSSGLSRLLEHPEAPYWVLLAVCGAVGLFLRINELGRQSLWFDEADAVMLARQPLVTLLKNVTAAGQNGPLYILFLHIWMLLFGTSEAVVRLPSALAGAAAIPLSYLVGRKLHGPLLGLYAAALFALSPYQHWHSQEAKMYAPLVCTVLAGTLVLLLAVQTGRVRHWLCYVVLMTLALYLHVMAALLIAAHAIWVVGWQRNRVKAAVPGGHRWYQRVPLASWAFAALTLPYLPIALWELQFVRTGAVTWHRPISLLAMLRDLLTKFSAGVRPDPTWGLIGAVVFGVLAILGALPLVWPQGTAGVLSPRRRSTFLLCTLLVPPGLFYLFQIVRPLYADRYLIVMTPALIFLVAGGLIAIGRLWRFLGPLVLIGLLIIGGQALQTVNLAPTAQKEDWREAYRQVADHWHPNDLLIIHPGYLSTTFDYYRLRDPRLQAMTTLTIPNEYWNASLPEEAIDGYLQQYTAGFERVWVVLSPDRVALVDPENRRGACETDFLRNWYCYNAHRLVDRELNGLWYALYAYNRPWGTAFYPPPPIRLDQPVGQQLTLVGYGYDFVPSVSSLHPGDSLPLVLHWSFRERTGEKLSLRWQLRNGQGQLMPNVGATELLLGGHLPLSFERSPYFWDYHDLVLPQSLPSGRYQLVVSVVSAADPTPPLAPGTIDLGWFTVR